MNELEVGSVQLVLHAGPPPWRSIILVLLKEGPRAYWNVCQHLPVPLDGGSMEVPHPDGELVCCTHGARYRQSDGYCTSGPCLGQNLVRVPVEVEGDVIYGLIADDGSPLRDP